MAYPPPPGINNLPARPPASKSGFKPAFNPTQSAAPSYATAPPSYAGPSSYSAAPAAPSTQYGSSYSSYQSGPAPGSVNSYAPQQQMQAQSYGPQSAGPQSYGPQSYGAPQIRNPFPMPGTGGGSSGVANDYDPDMAAQIAQWQSAYVSRDPKEGKPSTDSPKPEPQPAAVPNSTDRKKTVVREGGGKKWTDDSLLEWDPSHLRLFVGNLAGETTDEALHKAFTRWKSVQKARVIRDKRTAKSKGFGFVSFSDADDFFQAAKEMNGKYIQSHPVVVRKANTEIKVSNAKDKDRGKKHNKKKGGNGNGNGGGGAGGGYEPSLGPVGGVGVTKPGQKTKNGLRLLG
ncbi:hypothetical protein G7Z17_g12584 [Cylindrodendrum hubeiense]|uniref:RRM domain-containing protein n=1 Tax=Cylindrodendrum hubeiense TaxID=595255 RepID=A0A9P5GYQ3_9HYPO|nr:hypothetical protein G7Z17_g12584 [Cylindrodendrum hubeiense]